MTDNNITCEITKEIKVLSENDRGYTKEVNMVSWNGADAKLDIRNWHPRRPRSGKGITLNQDEAFALYETLNSIFSFESDF